MDFKLTIDASEAKAGSNTVDIAQTAHSFGREGNIIRDLTTYIRCLFNETSIDYEDIFTIDEEYVRDSIEKVSKELKAELIDSDIIIGEEYITVLKGADSIQIDEDEVLDLITDAFRTRSYGEIVYEPETASVEDIDLQSLYDAVYTEPEDAVYDKESGGVTQHAVGLSFDMNVAKELWDNADNGDEVLIPLIVTEPEITSDYLQGVLFSKLLGQKTTSLSGSSAARINNIAKASAAINGTILNPGEEFSYNGVVGQRTAAKGYMGAGAYNNGQVVTEIGGGICQVSSTLYYVSLLANLEIVERYCHYFEVNYLPLGLDATVSWPGPDFRFKNDRSYPIKIEAGTDTASLLVTIKIYGTDTDGSYVELSSEPWVTAMGRGATSYRWVYDKDGNLISKNKEASSQYHYHDSEGPETNAPEATVTPTTTPTASPAATPTATPTASLPPTQTVQPTQPPPTQEPPPPTQEPPPPTQEPPPPTQEPPHPEQPIE